MWAGRLSPEASLLLDHLLYLAVLIVVKIKHLPFFFFLLQIFLLQKADKRLLSHLGGNQCHCLSFEKTEVLHYTVGRGEVDLKPSFIISVIYLGSLEVLSKCHCWSKDFEIGPGAFWLCRLLRALWFFLDLISFFPQIMSYFSEVWQFFIVCRGVSLMDV